MADVVPVPGELGTEVDGRAAALAVERAHRQVQRPCEHVIADGEFEASAKLAEAARVLETQPSAIQLRYLQTLTEIGVEKNTTIVFPLPIDIINSWVQSLGGSKK